MNLNVLLGIFKWILLLPLSIFSTVIAYILAPILPLFCTSDGWLPSWLSWFQTPDNSCDGDNGWKTEHWLWRYKLPNKLSTYIGRVGWLWRNPCYGFDMNVLGAKNLVDKIKWEGNRTSFDTRDAPGWMFGYSGIYWCYFYRKGSLRVYLGWKLPNGDGQSYYQYVTSVNPFKNKV